MCVCVCVCVCVLILHVLQVIVTRWNSHPVHRALCTAAPEAQWPGCSDATGEENTDVKVTPRVEPLPLPFPHSHVDQGLIEEQDAFVTDAGLHPTALSVTVKLQKEINGYAQRFDSEGM